MEKTKPLIEKRYNKWIYIGVLYLSFIIGNLFNYETSAYSIIGQLNMLFSSAGSYVPYAVGVIIKLVAPLISVALFEIFSRVFYGLSNSFSLGAITMSSRDFTAALRIFVILSNLAHGILTFMYYFFNFLIPLGMIVLSFAITSVAYVMFFLYIDKHYLDKKTAHRAFRTMAVFYLAFSLFNIAGGIL